MMVLLLVNAPSQLKGYITRYLTEVHSGLFVGNPSARVRDLLWIRVQDLIPSSGRAVLVHNADNEQGYTIKYHNVCDKTVLDLDGMEIIAQVPQSDKGCGNRPKGHWSNAYWRMRNEH